MSRATKTTELRTQTTEGQGGRTRRINTDDKNTLPIKSGEEEQIILKIESRRNRWAVGTGIELWG